MFGSTGQFHAKPLSIEAVCQRLESAHGPVSKAFLSAFRKKLLSYRHSRIFLACYLYGCPIAQWSPSDRNSFIYHTPCGQQRQKCAECRELMAAGSNPIFLLLTNSCEVFVDTTTYSKLTGQAPSVPIEILHPGDVIGYTASPSDLPKDQPKDQPPPLIMSYPSFPRMNVTAGARSTFVGAPLNDQELFSRMARLFTNLRFYEHYETDFEKDSLLFLKVLSCTQESITKITKPWQVEVLVIPATILHDLFLH